MTTLPCGNPATMRNRPSLQLGDDRLVDLEHFADRLLGHRPRLAQFMQGHGCAKLRLAGVDARPALRREVPRQLTKEMSSVHSISSSFFNSFKCSS